MAVARAPPLIRRGPGLGDGAACLPLFLYISIVVVVSEPLFCGQGGFLLCWPALAPPCMLWASAAAVCAVNGDKGQCSPPSVDKCPVMPDLSPGLSLGAAQAPLFRKSPCATGGRFPGGCSTWAANPLQNHFEGPPGRRNGPGTTPARATRPAVSSGRALLRAASTLLFEEGGRMLFS